LAETHIPEERQGGNTPPDKLSELRQKLGHACEASFNRACLRHRMADRSVLGLIRMWLEAVVVEEGENGSGEKRTRNEKGTP